MACNRELPTGMFGTPPKAIYNTWLQYKNSGNYVPPYNWKAGRQEDADREYCRKMEHIKGKVVVYETHRDTRSVWLTPYAPIVTRDGDEVFETGREQMARHFTLPFLYNLFADDRSMLMEYLCMYMLPGDRVQIYTCWASEEKKKYKGPRRIVDLQDVVDGRHKPDGGDDKNILFVEYRAPSEPQDSPIMPLVRIDYTVMVVREDGSVLLPVHKALAEGLL